MPVLVFRKHRVGKYHWAKSCITDCNKEPVRTQVEIIALV